ncbi:hypothetical protein FALBO_896 [Fusarium albosuccineum]|uniref:Uncharacterized protein n=1 Tax=Fusarium albosuccineum TaxID=1237068 RepID=A0A8H4LP86_9HYPO|nr:hypothetical protein FALBO_896 [Fusarium albosuccineum]
MACHDHIDPGDLGTACGLWKQQDLAGVAHDEAVARASRLWSQVTPPKARLSLVSLKLSRFHLLHPFPSPSCLPSTKTFESAVTLADGSETLEGSGIQRPRWLTLPIPSLPRCHNIDPGHQCGPSVKVDAITAVDGSCMYRLDCFIGSRLLPR